MTPSLQDSNPCDKLKSESGLPNTHVANPTYLRIKAISTERSKSFNSASREADSYQAKLCRLSVCPPKLDLHQLLSSYRVKAVATTFMAQCSNLTRLSLRDVKMPPGVMHFVCTAFQSTRLQALDLSNCGLTDETAESLLSLLASPSLLDVQLGGNAWDSQHLQLILGGCSRVTSLGLGGLGDSCFHSESTCFAQIAGLKNLKTLDLDGFKDEAAEAVLSQCCTGLTSISLKDATELTQLPPSMSKLTGLVSLCIDGCTEIYSLPLWLTDMTKMTTLSLHGCNIQYPPKSNQDSIKKIKKFLLNARHNGKPWKRIKVVFLGNGRSGKTSLLRALAKLPLDSEEQSTRGVNVDSFSHLLQPNAFDKLRGFNIELSYWDFAGQLEYSASHDFFMSNKQAVYVIIFSATDDRESQQQQILFWLSAVASRRLQNIVRIMFVGTKIDLLSQQMHSEALSNIQASGGSPTDVLVMAASKFEAALRSMRVMVAQVLEEFRSIVAPDVAFGSRESFIQREKLNPLIATKEVVFVTSNPEFRPEFRMQLSTSSNLDFKHVRSAFKMLLYSTCNDIFVKHGESLKYPKLYQDMNDNVESLRVLFAAAGKLPCCSLDDELAVRCLGDGKKSYVDDENAMNALNVLNDLGFVVLYRVRGSRFVCVLPQFLSSIMSFLADPQSSISANTSASQLTAEIMKETSLFSHQAQNHSAQAELVLDLMVGVGLVIPSADDPSKLIVPLAFRGRPATRREVHQLLEAHVIGRRLGCSTSRVSASAFLNLMTSKCRSSGRMWGCAFTYTLESGGCVFVRLLEDRSKVDVVVMSSDVSSSHDEVNARFVYCSLCFHV